MALTKKQEAELKERLAEYLASQKWKTISVDEFDLGYKSLTIDDKRSILDSILRGDEIAKILIREKLKDPILNASRLQAQLYIDKNSIPVDVVADLF